MKLCPTCNEVFEDEDVNFCTYDGAQLGASGPSTYAYGRRTRHNSANKWKIAFFVLLFASIGAGAAGFYLLVQRESRAPESASVTPPAPAADRKENPTPTPDAAQPAVHLAELSREELLRLLPRNLLRRFHTGEQSQGIPDDFRIVNADGGEHVVLIGAGRLDPSKRTTVERLLVLKREGADFVDVTAKSFPTRYASGIISGHRGDARFDDGNPNLTIREPVSSSAIVDECLSCEHAYQEVMLQWKGNAYVETERNWENERYTVFYATADALEKRRIDARARLVLDKSVDAEIPQGFARNGKAGWSVELRGGDDQDKAEYELSNGVEKLLITLSRVKGQWKAMRVERP